MVLRMDHVPNAGGRLGTRVLAEAGGHLGLVMQIELRFEGRDSPSDRRVRLGTGQRRTELGALGKIAREGGLNGLAVGEFCAREKAPPRPSVVTSVWWGLWYHNVESGGGRVTSCDA